ncbi:hypothetical protein [Asticcacaulis sp.]|uniref:hypothetical protein n=1 Tax=Asticcacaulis sp. TaxID=1872648 RepID=UPI0039E67675
MRLERLKTIIEAYGAHAARWPEAEREAALALAQTQPQAQAWLEDARQLDAMMDAVKATDLARAEADQPVFEAAVERFAADFAQSRKMPTNVVAFPVQPARRQWHGGVPWPVVGGIGIAAAACLAGAIFGVNLSLMSLSDVRATNVLEQVAMIDGGN